MSTRNFLGGFFKQLKFEEEVLRGLGMEITFTTLPKVSVVEKPYSFLKKHKEVENINEVRDSSFLFVDIPLRVGNRDISYTAEYSVNQNLELGLQGKAVIEMDIFPNEVDMAGNVQEGVIPTINMWEEMITSLLGRVIETTLQSI